MIKMSTGFGWKFTENGTENSYQLMCFILKSNSFLLPCHLVNWNIEKR